MDTLCADVSDVFAQVTCTKDSETHYDQSTTGENVDT